MSNTDPGARTMFDLIIAYEEGELGMEEIYDLFKELVRTGLVYQLQGSYGRTARDLGLI